MKHTLPPGIRSTTYPDTPIADFNDWLEYIHNGNATWGELMRTWDFIRMKVWKSNGSHYPAEFILISDRWKRECFNVNIIHAADVVKEAAKYAGV